MALFSSKKEEQAVLPGMYVAKKFTNTNKIVKSNELLNLYEQAVEYANENDMLIIKISDQGGTSLGANSISVVFRKV